MQVSEFEDLFAGSEVDDKVREQSSAASAKVVDLKKRRRIEDYQEEQRLRRLLDDPWN